MADILALHLDRKIAVVEIAGNSADHTWARAGESQDLAENVALDVVYLPQRGGTLHRRSEATCRVGFGA
jgi:hypothetical protein